MIRVLHGEDEFSIEEAVVRFKASAGPPDLRDPNTAVFQGKGFKPADVIGAAASVPFLADKRIVIVRDLLSRMDERDKSLGDDWNNFAQTIQDPLPTTELIFVDHKPLRQNGRGLRTAGPGADIQEFKLPKGPALEAWVRDRFDKHGARAARDAVSRLAWLAGTDLRLIDQEIQKLTIYVDGREVTRQDVETMVADARQENIFNAVDSILERRSGVAMRQLYSLLDNGNTVASIIGLIARQVRILILASELLAQGVDQGEIGKRIGLNNRFVLEKTLRQTGRFSVEYLAGVHRRLLAADLAIKTGKLDERLALEILVGRLIAG